MAAHYNWVNRQEIEPREFTCGYCGREVGSNQGYSTAHGASARAYICPRCERISFTEGREMTPTPVYGEPILHLPTEVDKVYEESRKSIQAQAYSGAVLLCRKLLMHVAVEKGANAGETFQYYIDYLEANGYVPKDGKAWVDHIRQMGNRATHKIAFFTQAEAEEVLEFTAMLLRLVYEFPGKLAARVIP